MAATVNLKELESKIGYEFLKPELLRRAVTHSSSLSEGLAEVSNERLEYLGDAVLELLVTRLLFASYPDANEGQMTRIRAAVVSERPLSDIADRLNLGEYLILSRGMEKSGGRKLSSILSDAVEALIGALYLDGGIESAEKFIMPHMIPKIELAYKQGFKRDYKTRLQEYLQQDGNIAIQYRTESDDGPPHDKIFYTTVYADGKPLGKGMGKSKKESQQQAAKGALIGLNVLKE